MQSSSEIAVLESLRAATDKLEAVADLDSWRDRGAEGTDLRRDFRARLRICRHLAVTRAFWHRQPGSTRCEVPELRSLDVPGLSCFWGRYVTRHRSLPVAVHRSFLRPVVLPRIDGVPGDDLATSTVELFSPWPSNASGQGGSSFPIDRPSRLSPTQCGVALYQAETLWARGEQLSPSRRRWRSFQREPLPDLRADNR